MVSPGKTYSQYFGFVFGFFDDKGSVLFEFRELLKIRYEFRKRRVWVRFGLGSSSMELKHVSMVVICYVIYVILLLLC